MTRWQVFTRLQRLETAAHGAMQTVKAGVVCSKTWDWRNEQGREAADINTFGEVLRNVEFSLAVKQLILRGSDSEFNFGFRAGKEGHNQTCL